MSPAMDTEIIGGLLRFYIETEALLNIDPETRKEAEAVLKKMPELQIGKNGQLMEWLEDYEEVEPGHRHISHAFALYPDNAINRDTPELYDALHKTLELRLANGGGHTGWSRAWLMCLFARFQDESAFEENLRALFTKSTADNLLDMHPPFQIDGNFGGMAGICEALIQSHENRISLLPAMGENRTGYFKGLLARGGFTVSASFTKGLVTDFEITAKYDGEIRIELPDAQKNATVNGQKADESGIFVFPCESGNTYRFDVA